MTSWILVTAAQCHAAGAQIVGFTRLSARRALAAALTAGAALTVFAIFAVFACIFIATN